LGLRRFFGRWDLKITGGNAEVGEKKGITKTAIHKSVKRKELEIDSGTEALSIDLKVGIMGRNCGWCGSETT
jgi:hypothetical protein